MLQRNALVQPSSCVGRNNGHHAFREMRGDADIGGRLVESGGRNNFSIGPAEPAKRLHADDRTGVEAQDRLVERLDPAFAQRRVDLAGYLDAVLNGAADPGPILHETAR